MYKDGWGKEWCEKIVVKAILFSKNEWKECPGNVDKDKKYSVDEKNSRIATKVNGDNDCTIIGNALIPFNTVTSWSVKVHNSKDNNGNGINIGIAPFDINQNEDRNYNKCGWYFYCYSSTLWSGPPHSYSSKEYGPMKEEDGQYVHTGDSVGVVMDTAKGDLSFILNNVNLGVAYEGIPLDKPLVPCILLHFKDDSVELNISEVKENVDSSMFVPSNITTKNEVRNSITLTWDEVSDASFYQIEVDGSNSGDASTTNTFTKRNLFPNREYVFRVRAVRENSVGEWSDDVRGKTLEAPEFYGCVWKECPDDVDVKRKYVADKKSPRIATKAINSHFLLDDECTIIGNTLIPPNAVTSWDIKILKSKFNNGEYIYIGIAPSDINQNVDNYYKCGWYFYCYKSTLWSGPPHNYRGKEYGPRKEKGEYVHTGSIIGVLVDTTKGELSFVLNGENRGVAYEGIPLDKPLVPCVILWYETDSVELII